VSKTILIAPFDGPLAGALAQAAREAGWAAALATAPRRRAEAPRESVREDARDEPGAERAPEAPEAGAGCVALPYDPESYVSTAALVTAACNALGDIDVAVLVADRRADLVDLSAGKPGELGSLVGGLCAGPLYLVRELARRFEARKSGAILLATPERPRDAGAGAVAALAEGAFEGLGRGLFAQAEGSCWRAFGLVDASGQPDRAARYALSLLEDPRGSKAGRWLRYTGKAGLFGQG